MQRRHVLALLPLLLAGCMTDSKTQVLATDKSQVALRAVQTRLFDTGDRAATFRAVMATLQDLGFVIDKADDVLGTVSATKLSGYVMRMTVTVRPHGPKQTMVRANAQYNLEAVTDAAPYQQFFDALAKAMFLSANQIE